MATTERGSKTLDKLIANGMLIDRSGEYVYKEKEFTGIYSGRVIR